MLNFCNILRFWLMLACTAILTAGCVSELSSTDASSCDILRYETLLRVTLKDESVITATFLQLEMMPCLEYIEHYRKEMEAEYAQCGKLPVPGERIYVSTAVAPYEFQTGTMIGFCHRYFWVRLKGESELSQFQVYSIARIVRSNGQSIFRDDLRKLMASNQLPLMTKLSLWTGQDTLHIALDDIKHLESLEHGNFQPIEIFALNSGMTGVDRSY